MMMDVIASDTQTMPLAILHSFLEDVSSSFEIYGDLAMQRTLRVREYEEKDGEETRSESCLGKPTAYVTLLIHNDLL
jgi:hypothetical protein